MVEATWNWQKNKNRLGTLEENMHSTMRASQALVLPFIYAHQCKYDSLAIALC